MAVDEEANAGTQSLHHVKSLLRKVLRGFYQPKHCILLDIILRHSAIRDDYIGLVMGLQNQEIRKLCGRLREDRLITMQTKIEYREGQTRPINRTYYFVDYRDATDSIKFRLHKLVRTVEEKSRNDFDSKGYVCSYCGRRYGPLDVLPLVTSDGQGFNCADCGSILNDDEESSESRASQERLGRLQKQTDSIIKTLKVIDTSFVPNNDFNNAFLHAILPLEVVESIPSRMGEGSASSLTAAEITTTAALGVAVDYEAFKTESPEEKARRLDQAQKNALPDWHAESTISGEVIVRSNRTPADLDNEDQKATKLDAQTETEVEAYYRSLKQQTLEIPVESEGEDMDLGDVGDVEEFQSENSGLTPKAQPEERTAEPVRLDFSDSEEDDFEDV